MAPQSLPVSVIRVVVSSADLSEVGAVATNVSTESGNAEVVSCGACSKVLGVLSGQLIPENTAYRRESSSACRKWF